jgi:16S rRNA (adenine(1408)-N(1))-methyltransferase
VIDRARQEPDTLVLGVDANAAALAESSRRAARSTRRGGLPNAAFIVAGAERPPPELVGIADELTITLPWGSLLAGALAIDPAAAAGIASFMAIDGRVRILVSIVDNDQLNRASLGAHDAATLAQRWARHRLRLVTFRPATDAEVDASRSSWARRLAAGRRRPAWLIELNGTDVAERAR